MSFTPLSAIRKDIKNVRIKVRVVRRWDFINPHNESQIFSFELLFIDEKGTTIQFTIPDQIATPFRKQLLEGNVYHISGFNIIEAQKTYKISTHHLRVKLPQNAYINEIQEPNMNIPYEKFNFIDLADMEARRSNVDYLCDTFGQLIRVGNVEQVRIGTKIMNKRTLFLQDTSELEVQFTLWEQCATTFPIDDVLSMPAEKPIIIAFVGMIVKPFNDSYTVSSTSATKLYINPPLADISTFLQRLPKPYTKLTQIEYRSREIVDIETEKMLNRKTISELLHVDIHTDKDIKFICQAKIKNITNEDGWWYRACPSCKTSVKNQEDKIWCKKCNYIDTLPIPWYKIPATVYDHTAEATFIIFGHRATDLIGIPPSNLVSKFPDPTKIPPMVMKLRGMEKIFQIQVSRRVDDPSDISFKVTHIFKDEFPPPRTETPSPTNVVSSHLFTPYTSASLSTQKKVQATQSGPSATASTHNKLKATQSDDNLTDSNSIASGSNIQNVDFDHSTSVTDSEEIPTTKKRRT